MSDTIRYWLKAFGMRESTADVVTPALGIFIIVVASILLYYLCSRIILARLARWSKRSSIQWDDVLVERRVIHRLAYLAPVLAAFLLTPLLLEDRPELVDFLLSAVQVAVVVIGVWVVHALLNAVYDIYAMLDARAEMPIHGPIQGAKMVVAMIGALFVGAIVLDQSPLYLLTGLGALSAILMLIFRDPILGFAAGIHLASNNMVSPGDWIEMPTYDADGDVIEVGLTTVKVQNFDNTITMVPTYALISESFKNWRGMAESGGRRMKRALYIDVNSIKFCSDEMVDRFSEIDLLVEYLMRKRVELEYHNHTLRAGASPVNGRRLTNIGTFRAYIEAYLRQEPSINQEMSFLVRQMAPTEHGLPIQIYVFCKEKSWETFEAIQADIFDHLLAAVPEFDLKVFQNPSGGDFAELA